MALDASDLKLAAQANRGESPSPSSTETRVDKIYKMFTPEERVRAIKDARIEVEIGSGAEKRTIVIRPLSPRQFIEAFGLIREVLVPIMGLYGATAGSPGMAEIIGVLGDKIDRVPELIHFIIKRGNEVSLDWIMDNFDLGLDLQLILPPFIIQNGLERVLGGTDAPATAAQNGAFTEKPQTQNSSLRMVESPE